MDPAAAELRNYTDAVLCQLWQRTFFGLVGVRDPKFAKPIVERRKLLLDELERPPSGSELYSRIRFSGVRL